MATNDELKAQLDEMGVSYPSNATKADLEALIEENSEADAEEEVEETDSEEEAEDAGTEDEEADEADESEDEETDSEVETEDASGEVTVYGVYKGGTCVATFNSENHGPDFVKIAEKKAEAMGGEAKPFVEPTEAAKEKTVVNIVNRNGNLVRQYAKSVHGADYKKLADAFIEKYGEKKGLHIQ